MTRKTDFGMNCRAIAIFPAWNCLKKNQGISAYGTAALRYLVSQGMLLHSADKRQTERLPCDLNEQAEELFSRLVKQLAEKEGVTEALKAENQMLWVQKMNSIRSAAMEVVSNDLIYA